MKKLYQKGHWEKKIVLSFQSSELSIEFGTAIAALLVQLHNGDRNIFEVAFTFLYCFFLKS